LLTGNIRFALVDGNLQDTTVSDEGKEMLVTVLTASSGDQMSDSSSLFVDYGPAASSPSASVTGRVVT
jgi:hypothetical protein